MPTVTLQAHYDGQQILLDEPFDLPPNARLMVTLLPVSSGEERDTRNESTPTAYQLTEDLGLIGAFDRAGDQAGWPTFPARAADSIAAFRGRGQGGATQRLLADRQADREREA